MKTPPLSSISVPTLGWLLVSLLLVTLPHMARLPISVTLLFLVLLTWRYLTAIYHWRPISRIFRTLLTFLTLLLVYVGHDTLVGRDAGVSLLVAMLAIKLLETYTRRDVYITILIAYFLVITHFFYSQTIFSAIYMFLAIIVVTATLIDLNRRRHSGKEIIADNLRKATRILGEAIPFMIILFVLFPRIGSPLWGLPSDVTRGMTGLDDEMAPGQISRLSQSDAVAFRVKFKGNPPSSSDLYWRGPVLWYTNGERWRPDQHANTVQRRHGQAPDFIPLNNPFTYTITLEAHNRRWLYALDLPITAPPQTRISHDFQIMTTKNVTQRVRYDVTSHVNYTFPTLSMQDRRRALQLPDRRNPRTQLLGQTWQAQLRDDVAIVQRALRMYRQDPYVYTLTPPRLTSANPMDEFLFDTRRGFCEHFAASFTILMRAAGIPTRVVTGYQGGERNPVGDYLIVRQRDAHAWSEVWLNNVGWVRIDPTAAVAPERVEMSINNIPSGIGDAVRFDLSNNAMMLSVLKKLSFGWDSFNNGWNQWVLSYNLEQQKSFLRNSVLGIESWQGMVTTLAVTVTVILLGFSAFILRQNYVTQDPVNRVWHRYCAKLGRHGIKRERGEGPVDFTNRIVNQRPELRLQAECISQLYILLRYGANPGDHQLNELRRKIRAFRP